MKRLYILAGANGSGKSTISKVLLPSEQLVYVNPDDIAKELNPDNPTAARIEAGRETLRRIDELLTEGESFAIESTLSGNTYVKVLERQEGDPPDWVRIEWRQDEDEVRFGKLCWVINGHKVQAEPSDINLLSTFLDGKEILTGSRGAKSPLKKQLPRLCELLGAAKK